MDEKNQSTPSPMTDGLSPDATPKDISGVPEKSDQEQAVKEISIPDEAQDSDLIEKEWVDKAKEIVEHTRDNPHEQQRAFNLMKAEYMKKRYNKDIKIDES